MFESDKKPKRAILSTSHPYRGPAEKKWPAKNKPQSHAAPARMRAPAAPVNTPELLEIAADSLAYNLIAAAEAVTQVIAGMALPQALQVQFDTLQASPATRGAVQDLAYRCLRQYGRSEILIQLLTNKRPEPALLHSMLCCALALLQGEADGSQAYEDFVVVDQAVNAAAASAHMVFAKAMVNAVLRRFLRERDELLKLAHKQPLGAWNYPQWWVDQMKTAYPEQWQDILRSADTQPPLTLRVNQRQHSVSNYLAILHEAGIQASVIGETAIKLHKALPVLQLPGFSQGWVSVQDAAAQLAGPLLDVQAGMRVLDACAAPGGKTCHLLELADVNMQALDVEASRLSKVRENLERLQLKAGLVCGDASRRDWWDGELFDRILADVPCTASGVVRRHPDSRWLRRKTDTAQLVALSARILDNLWGLLKPGGKLLMVTCSVWPAESELQAQSFAARHGALRLPAPGQLLPLFAPKPEQAEHDGLFYALFEKPRATV